MSAGRNNISIVKEYNTPPKYVDLINKFFGYSIDLDPCSNEYSTIAAKIRYILPQDGLKESWEFNKIFVNPPYGRQKESKTSIYNWIYKGKLANEWYNSEILYLIPVATNTKHFKDIIFKYFNGICFLADTRLKFYYKGQELIKGAPMSCCFTYIGNNYDKFKDTFEESGKCFRINP